MLLFHEALRSNAGAKRRLTTQTLRLGAHLKRRGGLAKQSEKKEGGVGKQKEKTSKAKQKEAP